MRMILSALCDHFTKVLYVYVMYLGRQVSERNERDRVATVDQGLLAQMDGDESPSVLPLSRTISGGGCDRVVAVEGLRYLSGFVPSPFSVD